DEPQHDLPALGLADVDRDAPFAAIEDEKARAVAGRERGAATATVRVARESRFDLDDVRALVREVHARARPGEMLGHVNDANAAEHAVHVRSFIGASSAPPPVSSTAVSRVQKSSGRPSTGSG